MGSFRGGGYGQFCLSNRGKEVNVVATRIAYLIDKKIDPVGKCIMHMCDNPKCVNPNHLIVGTPKDNTEDMMKKKRGGGFFKKGSCHPKSKLMEEMIYDIKRMYSDGNTQKEIASKYSVDPSLISRIVNGQYWSHTQNDQPYEN